jgi:hypothetical protein
MDRINNAKGLNDHACNVAFAVDAVGCSGRTRGI